MVKMNTRKRALIALVALELFKEDYIRPPSPIAVHGLILSMGVKVLVKEAHICLTDFSEVWIQNYLDHDFFLLFRMTRSTFDILMRNIINDANTEDSHTGGFEKIPVEKALQMTLLYLGKGDTLTNISERFNVAKSTAHATCLNYIKAICNLKNKYIRWPYSTVEKKIVVNDFLMLYGYPGVLGCIDAYHIYCKVPPQQHETYANIKLQHSIILQAVCTSKQIFTNICTGFPGSLQNALVLKESSIYKNCKNRGSAYLFNDFHLLGDSTYPCVDWLLTPYRDTCQMTVLQRHHNKIHRKTRVVIENAFDLLKHRWKIMNYINANSIKKIVHIIVACCVLHNFCIINLDNLVNEDVNRVYETYDVGYCYKDNHPGISKRNEICDNI